MAAAVASAAVTSLSSSRRRRLRHRRRRQPHPHPRQTNHLANSCPDHEHHHHCDNSGCSLRSSDNAPESHSVAVVHPRANSSDLDLSLCSKNPSKRPRRSEITVNASSSSSASYSSSSPSSSSYSSSSSSLPSSSSSSSSSSYSSSDSSSECRDQSLLDLPSNLSLCEDMWFLIFDFLNPSSLIQLSLVNRAFHSLVMERCVWMIACHRDLKVPYHDAIPRFPWRNLYEAVTGTKHSYSFHNSAEHIDWLRVGTFRMESGEALLSSQLPAIASSRSTNLESCTTRVSNVIKGPWIVDMHLLRCSVCTQPTCDGTVQVLDARHWELFFHEEYISGEWNFEEIEEQVICPSPQTSAMAAIFDAKHVRSSSTKELLNLKSWTFPPGIFHPSTSCKTFAVAASTNLRQENEAKLVVKLYTMAAKTLQGQNSIVAIRITQALAQS